MQVFPTVVEQETITKNWTAEIMVRINSTTAHIHKLLLSQTMYGCLSHHACAMGKALGMYVGCCCCHHDIVTEITTSKELGI